MFKFILTALVMSMCFSATARTAPSKFVFKQFTVGGHDPLGHDEDLEGGMIIDVLPIIYQPKVLHPPHEQTPAKPHITHALS